MEDGEIDLLLRQDGGGLGADVPMAARANVMSTS
jgi:hypothetical protein